MNIQRGDSQLGRKRRAVSDPSPQRCGPVHISMFDEHFAKVAAASLADLPGYYLGHRNEGATEGTAVTCIVKIILYHSLAFVAIYHTPSSNCPVPRNPCLGRSCRVNADPSPPDPEAVAQIAAGPRADNANHGASLILTRTQRMVTG